MIIYIYIIDGTTCNQGALRKCGQGQSYKNGKETRNGKTSDADIAIAAQKWISIMPVMRWHYVSAKVVVSTNMI